MTAKKTDGGTPPLASTCVRKLLDRHGVEERQRPAAISQALGLSYQQARRRMSGTTQWTLDELQVVAEHFDESLKELVSSAQLSSAVRASLICGPLQMDCALWAGDESRLGRSGPLVAIKCSATDWMVIPATDALKQESYEVKRLVLNPGAHAPKLVAILDSDRALARSIADDLACVGIESAPFASFGALASALGQATFDGYIVDWSAESENARSLLGQIRMQDAHCPIVLLTCRLQEGLAGESELAAVAAAYRLVYFEKPIRTTSILSALRCGFESRPLSRLLAR